MRGRVIRSTLHAPGTRSTEPGADRTHLQLPTLICKAWVAVPTLFLAVSVIGNFPVAEGVPEIVAVPLRLSVMLNPAGSAPDAVMAGVGKPPVDTANVKALPLVAEAVLALVNVGA